MTKLQSDLYILEVMADGLADYLQGDALFGKTSGRVPKLTLGGYLMRQHRLTALQGDLQPAEQARLQQAVAQGEAALASQIVRSEARATQECHARLRQWEEVIRDLRRDARAHFAGYATAVEPRAMLTQLIHLLAQPPYQLDSAIPERLALLDGALRNSWDDGECVWSAEWEAAYPRAPFWWLYGRPIALRPQ
jgi:hypothetical protein